jgi:hypothetical protein
MNLSDARKFELLLKRQKGGDWVLSNDWRATVGFIIPAPAGSLVQIQPPQPNHLVDLETTCRCSFCGQTVSPQSGEKLFQRSSVVERSAVNRLVVGSNPTAGANFESASLIVLVVRQYAFEVRQCFCRSYRTMVRG